MREFFNLDPMADEYDTYSNLFTEDEIGPRGSICAELADGRRLLWDRNDSGIRAHHSATISRDNASLIVDAARRAGLLSCLSILQTRVGEGTQAERLFHLTVNSILYGVQVPSGGTERSIHELWSNLLQKSVRLSATPTPQDIQSLDEEVREFNSLFAAKLDLLKETTESLLEYFVGHGLEIQFVFPPLKYVHHKIKTKRRFIPAELHVTIKFRGRTIDAWEGFLNEARLSALAISLFLAGVLASNPAPSPGHGSLDFISRSLVAEVESMRSNVLNALSHANSPGLNKAEVKDAIDTVEKLQKHSFPKP